MTKRVDALRKSYQNAQWGPPGLAVIGTPGIGELVPIHLFCGLDNLSGKTMFLVYYLIRELVHARPTVYFSRKSFYIFTNEGVHLIDREGASFWPSMEIHDLPC